jgi:hypothetical protein
MMRAFANKDHKFDRTCALYCRGSARRRHGGHATRRIHILDISEPRRPRLKNVIEREEIKDKLGLSAPHTVHCMPGDIVTISMLGDAEGNLPGGFAGSYALDPDFFVDFHEQADGARPHEIHLPGGDCTTEIFQ